MLRVSYLPVSVWVSLRVLHQEWYQSLWDGQVSVNLASLPPGLLWHQPGTESPGLTDPVETKQNSCTTVGKQLENAILLTRDIWTLIISYPGRGSISSDTIVMLVTSSCYVAYQCIQELLGTFILNKNVDFNWEKEKESIIWVRIE